MKAFSTDSWNIQCEYPEFMYHLFHVQTFCIIFFTSISHPGPQSRHADIYVVSRFISIEASASFILRLFEKN